MRRQYLGFRQLVPNWIGCRIDPGIADTNIEAHILGRNGLRGSMDRVLFKQMGIVPAAPDLQALSPGLIHAQFGRGGALALPLAQLLGIPLAVTFHGGDAHKDKNYRRRIFQPVFQRRLEALKQYASIFICVSESVKGKLSDRGFPPEKLANIGIGVELDSLRPRPRTPHYFLFAGRFVQKKGIPILIQAARTVRAKGVDTEFVFIGDGPLLGEMKRLASDIENTTFMGWQSADEVRRWMRGALALCVPSITAAQGDAEGLPSVALEAMSSGVAVIGSDQAGLSGLIEHERSGLLVQGGQSEALAASLLDCIAHPEKVEWIGTNAYAHVRSHFSAALQSRALEQALLSVIRGGHGRLRGA